MGKSKFVQGACRALEENLNGSLEKQKHSGVGKDRAPKGELVSGKSLMAEVNFQTENVNDSLKVFDYEREEKSKLIFEVNEGAKE